jgi:cytochrome c553
MLQSRLASEIARCSVRSAGELLTALMAALVRTIVTAVLLAAPVFSQTIAQTAEFFERKVRPILAAQCQSCHNAKLKTAELDLSTPGGFRGGGQSGPVVSPDQPEASRLLKVIGYEERLKMPPTGKLQEDEIAVLTEWVRMGAPWPGAPETAAGLRPASRQLTDEDRSFWAFQPLRAPQPPAPAGGRRRSPIDQFIQAKLDEKGLPPAPPAGKLALLRRVTFDLTGLPPSEQEIREFLADQSPDAYRRVIDRLLASPRYGERWGRHWLDVARYADSTGNDEDHRYPYAWRYRDYVIEAFNQDLPYDQFIREQIAGDLLPAHAGEPLNRRGIIATGFLALGAKALAQQDKKRMLYDVYDEQIDVVSKAFLGVTAACARCHDHKFDPILTKDYYSLVSIFASTKSFADPDTHVSKLLFTPLVEREIYEAYTAHQEKVKRQRLEIDEVVDAEIERYNERLSPRLADYMLAARQIYEGGADLAGAARAKSLDAGVLQKWAEYLQPDGEEIRPHLKEWSSAAPEARESVARGYQERFQARLAEWTKRLRTWRAQVRKRLLDGNMPPPTRPSFEAGEDRFFHEVFFRTGPFAVQEKDRESVFSPEGREALSRLQGEMEDLQKASPPEPDMACAVQEGEPVTQRVLIRGDYGNPGEEAPKAFPAVLARPDDPVVTTGSGRLELAEWLARPENPLTARVMVNRIWQWHFGEGLVRTPDNFGRTGDRPSHPELLDYLARRFVESGWSVKAMHRLILLSDTYQRSSQAPAQALAVDPENRLLARFPRRRLDVEEIRDGMLVLDGTLDFTVGGTLQTGFGTDGENSNDRLSLNPEKHLRRTVYLPLRRANLPSLLNLFDFGDAVTAAGKRPSTNVAPQALFMLNSEFVAERSQNLAASLLEDASLEPEARLEKAYLRILNRPPAAAESDAGLRYIARFQERFPGEGVERKAWQSFCRVLLASNEFIYVD